MWFLPFMLIAAVLQIASLYKAASSPNDASVIAIASLIAATLGGYLIGVNQ
jgi:hypothetical protein